MAACLILNNARDGWVVSYYRMWVTAAVAIATMVVVVFAVAVVVVVVDSCGCR
jgi:hypothetical protein